LQLKLQSGFLKQCQWAVAVILGTARDAFAGVVAVAEAAVEAAGHSLHEEEGDKRHHHQGPQSLRVAGRHRA
jgi:hypothetical protein